MGDQIEAFFDELDRWADEARAVRTMLLAAGLTEEVKWNNPCYTHHGKNLVVIAPYKKYFALSFFQGVLLKDDLGVLTSPGKDSQSVKQWRFTTLDEIEQHKSAITAYVTEAMGHAAAGTTVDFAAKDELELPDELVERFDTVDGLEDAFMALTPGRQRGFVLNINGAKQSSTRFARVDKHTERIMAGKAIHDCICGKSTRMPRCDGSHSR